ncbi:hypothetical protein NliqN6_6554 [Naganishia liquefaciens]|uniref:Uncharacterized protein n=1 Tax=Naganishia liquefaciens TaxID=104408 RepID=A0A8H3TZX2_9TREE|nr:hypothetical protein NliqN6_6554 [Naganishia liquefaciens]
MMQSTSHSQESEDNETNRNEHVKESPPISPPSRWGSEASGLLHLSATNIEIQLRPLTPFFGLAPTALPPIPRDEPENHSAMLSTRLLPLPLLQESSVNYNLNKRLDEALQVPHLEIPPSAFSDASALPPFTNVAVGVIKQTLLPQEVVNPVGGKHLRQPSISRLGLRLNRLRKEKPGRSKVPPSRGQKLAWLASFVAEG